MQAWGRVPEKGSFAHPPEIGAKIPYLTNSSKAVTVGGPEERVHLQLLIVLLEEIKAPVSL